ncbi:MAG: NAD(P)/FAD-dependent oxidoreductase [Acetobacterales bacterium]
MTDHVDAVVIGAGVVGLAVARALALKGHWVIVAESTDVIGSGVSSRNSEVIHAGIYYPTGSLKATFCVEGRRRLYAYAAEKGFEAHAIGKLIVAADGTERDKLEVIRQKAEDNDVGGLEMLSGNQATALEPNLACTAALHSTVSGIVDSHAFMLALQGDLEDAGGMIAFKTPVLGAELSRGTIRLRTGGDEPTELTTDILVNSAGLHAPAVARSFHGLAPEHVPDAYLCKGNYFALEGVKAPFRKLIYPMPNEAGLGIHATTDLAWQNRFGPDTEWVEEEDYAANSGRLEEFEAAIRRYYPALPAGALIPVYAGIRPKIVGPGEAAADFVVQGADVHGFAGLINLFGIESPGLTSALAIADAIVDDLH